MGHRLVQVAVASPEVYSFAFSYEQSASSSHWLSAHCCKSTKLYTGMAILVIERSYSVIGMFSGSADNMLNDTILSRRYTQII